MRRHWPRIVLLLLSFVLATSHCARCATAATAEGIQWQTDLEAAKTLAKQTNRLVLVHFWTPTCGPCVTLDQTVFNQAGVASAIEQQFVPVKLNANENSATATGFGITRVPTDVVLTPDGHAVGKLISPPTPGGYVAELTKVAAAYTSVPGRGFADAAAAAPAPSQINAAYANLPIGVSAPPGAPMTHPLAANAATNDPFKASGVANDRFAAPPLPTVGAGSVGAQNASLPPITPVGGSQAAFAPPQPTAPVTAVDAGTSPTGNRYGTPSAAATPSVVENRYVASTPPSPNGAAPFSTPTSPVAPVTAPQAAAPVSYGAPAVTPQGYSPAGTQPAAVAGAPQFPTWPAIPQQQQQPQESGAPALISGSGSSTLSLRPDAGPAATVAQPGSVAAQSPAASATPDGRQLPPGAPPLGFDGFCPVSMRTQWKWVAGDPRWGIVHRGRTYWFATQNEQQQFWADPDRFSPALSGMDPVLAIDHQQQVPGKREHSIDYDGLFYMFSSEATLAQFTANPERYAVSVRQAMGIPRGRLVR